MFPVSALPMTMSSALPCDFKKLFHLLWSSQLFPVSISVTMNHSMCDDKGVMNTTTILRTFKVPVPGAVMKLRNLALRQATC